MAERSLLERPAWPVLFTLILTVVFVGLLAVLFRLNEPRIEEHKRETYERTVLSLCADSLASLTGTSAREIEAAYPQSFQDYFTLLPEGTFPRPAYEVRHSGNLLAYVFDIPGKGLWGTMRALVATTTDKATLIGISIYEQVETPGLGARIEEEWFTSQFRQKPAIRSGLPLRFVLIPEGQEADAPDQIRQITGATITSVAVINMIQTELAAISGLPAEVEK